MVSWARQVRKSAHAHSGELNRHKEKQATPCVTWTWMHFRVNPNMERRFTWSSQHSRCMLVRTNDGWIDLPVRLVWHGPTKQGLIKSVNLASRNHRPFHLIHLGWYRTVYVSGWRKYPLWNYPWMPGMPFYSCKWLNQPLQGRSCAIEWNAQPLKCSGSVLYKIAQLDLLDAQTVSLIHKSVFPKNWNL